MNLTLLDLIRQALEEVDNELRREGIEIFQRPSHALIKLGQRFPQLNGVALFPVRNPQTELEEIPGEIQSWYSDRYGERLKYDSSVGSYPIMIREEAWQAKLPLCYGRIQFTWNSNFDTHCGDNVINIPTKIVDFSPALAQGLSDSEVDRVSKEYLWAIDVLTSISSNVNGIALAPAVADYNAAMDNLFSRNPHNGQCKWSALQFAEKSIKQKLIGFGSQPKHTHNLQKLADNLVSHGVKISSYLIAEVQCEASARYGEILVDRSEAVKAVQSALKIYSLLYPQKTFEISG